MKAELRDLTPKPPREVVVTMSEEEARELSAGIWLEGPLGKPLDDFGQMLRRVVED